MPAVAGNVPGRRALRGARFAWLFAAVSSLPLAADDGLDVDGHTKLRLGADRYPADSVMALLTGKTASQAEAELRLNASLDRGGWQLQAAWQAYAGYGDGIELRRSAAGTLPVPQAVTDDRRLMNLTDTVSDRGKSLALHRLDRLVLGYTADSVVVRIGRQALSWGNGLVFSPLDVVNPFDPVAVDTEYKAGDDMLYVQWLLENGNDLQFAHVLRRDPASGNVRRDAATTAIKFHAVAGESEFDLLAARHFGESVVGIGGNRGLGGAVLRGDVVWTDADAGSALQMVANLSYSWVWAGRNTSGMLEYYHSAFGRHAGDYDLASITADPALAGRLARGDAFTLGRHYLAAGLTIEVSPLWRVSPNLFWNLDDQSALLQSVSRWSLGANAELLASLNLPLGPAGSEFGGVLTTVPGTFLSTDVAFLAQLAFYF